MRSGLNCTKRLKKVRLKMAEEMELKPCSKCGGVQCREIHTVHKKNGSVMYYGRCACGNKTHPYNTPERAAAAWNRRYEDANAEA